MPALRRPQALLLLVTAIWGSTFVITKDLLPSCPPLPYLSVRFLIGAAVVLWLTRRAAPTPGLLRDTVVLGALQAAGLLLQILGQAHTTASKSAFLTALSGPLTPLCALLLRGERPQLRKLAAMAVGLLGLLLLTYPRGGADWNRGDLITALCAAVYSVAIVETAHRARRHDALRLGALQIAASAIFFLLALALVRALPPGALGELSRQEARPLVLSPTLIVQVIYLGLGCTAFTYTVQTWAMARMSATDAALIFSLEPVVASALGLAVLGRSEWPGTAGAIGCALVLVAVLAAELGGERSVEVPGVDDEGAPR